MGPPDDVDQLRRRRLTAQLLAGRRARSVTDAVRRILAVQAQDGRGARLAVRARTTGSTAAAVDAALTEDRALVVSWLNRGTLHLVAAEDWWWLHPLTTPQLATGNRRRLAQEGVSPAQAERGVEVVLAATADRALGRAELRMLLDDAGVPTAGQALVHVLLAATLHGELVRGPVVGGEQAWVGAAAWIGPRPAPLDRGTALHRLGERYVAGHAPTSAEDLATWAGITLTDARRALADVDPAPAARPATLPAPQLLGPFDPLLHGWRSREPFVGAHRGVVTTNGIFRPVALVEGRVVATWGLADGVLTIRPLESIPAAALDALVEDGARVLAFLGRPASGEVVVAPGPA